jgi:hypothetical protein
LFLLKIAPEVVEEPVPEVETAEEVLEVDEEVDSRICSFCSSC